MAIGVVEGDPVYQLDGVEDVARTHDGHVVVAHAGSEIRVYDPLGRFVRTIGREGDGPGEFRGLGTVQPLSGDTILAIALEQMRVTAFDLSGALLWTTRLETDGSLPLYEPVASTDGSLVMPWRAGEEFQMLFDGQVRIGQTVRAPATVIRHAVGDSRRDTVGVFPGFEQAFGGTPERPSLGATPFGRLLVYSAHQDRVYVGTGESYEIRIYEDLSLARIVRRSGLDLRVTPEAVDSVVRARAQDVSNPDARAAFVQSFTEAPRPGQRAPYLSLLVDSEGYLWVGRYRFLAPPRRFDVFDPTGRWLGELALPERFELFEVGRDYVLGSARGALDVEQVRMYRVIRDIES